MYRIFCLAGKSGTGKDTLSEALLRAPELKLARLVLHTTRPRRPNETDGESYHFLSPGALEALIAERGLVERRDYHTALGLWSYCTLPDGGPVTSHRLAVTPLPALAAYRAHFGAESVVPLYIEVPDGQRLLRAAEREALSGQPCYAEVCRRYLADEEDFSAEKLSACGIGRVFVNGALDVCVNELTEYIAQYI
ncbi:MAG: guanylate kinase [Oscillospiraceae bacterium]|nr:guanylate kinase [Oscillospiraceae bacterium]